MTAATATKLSKQTITENALARIGDKSSAESKAWVNAQIERQFADRREVFKCSRCESTVIEFGIKCADCERRAELKREIAAAPAPSDLQMWLLLALCAGAVVALFVYSFATAAQPKSKPVSVQTKLV